MPFSVKISVFVTGSLLFAAALNAAELATDPQTGLKIAPGFETVKMNCTTCHGASQITRAGFVREEWLSAIRWMQKEQGLWEFAPEVEKEILDYLETHYPPKQ